MSNVEVTQSISKERQALYDEYDRLWKHNDRESNEKRQAIRTKLVKAPTVVVTTSEYDEKTDTLKIHHEWRE